MNILTISPQDGQPSTGNLSLTFSGPENSIIFCHKIFRSRRSSLSEYGKITKNIHITFPFPYGLLLSFFNLRCSLRLLNPFHVLCTLLLCYVLGWVDFALSLELHEKSWVCVFPRYGELPNFFILVFRKSKKHQKCTKTFFI